jgi:hypothetical protein
MTSRVGFIVAESEIQVFHETMAKLYLAVVQAVLLYGADTWAVSKRAINRLWSFHHRCAQYITRQYIQKDENDEWICPASAEVLEHTGLKTIDEYITKRKNMLKHYATSRAIYRECERLRPLAIFQQRSWFGRLRCSRLTKTTLVDPRARPLRNSLTTTTLYIIFYSLV